MTRRLLAVLVGLSLLVVACGDDGGDGETGVSSSESGAAASTSPVLVAEQQLAAIGCDPGSVDGVAGSATDSAVTHFQYATGLPQTGELDGGTLDAIDDAASGGETVCTDENVPRDDFGEPDCYVGIDEGCECPEGEECLTDPASTFSDAELDGYRTAVRGQFATRAAAECDGSGDASEVEGLTFVEFSGTAEGFLEGFVTGEGFSTVPFSLDTTSNDPVVFGNEEFCTGLGE